MRLDTYGFLASLKLHDRAFERATVDSRAKHSVVLPYRIHPSTYKDLSYPVFLRHITKDLAAGIKELVHYGDTDSFDPLLCAMDGTEKRGWPFSNTDILLNNLKVTQVKTDAGLMFLIRVDVGIELQEAPTTVDGRVADASARRRDDLRNL